MPALGPYDSSVSDNRVAPDDTGDMIVGSKLDRSRRAVVKASMVAGAFAWTTPFVATTRLSRIIGSPSPSTTTQQDPNLTPFDGRLRGTFTVESGVDCFVDVDATMQGTLSPFGDASVTMQLCAEIPPSPQTGTFNVAVPGGTFAASFVGTSARNTTPIPLDASFTVDGGTGLYAGAVGSGTLTASFLVGDLVNTVTAHISGYLDL